MCVIRGGLKSLILKCFVTDCASEALIPWNLSISINCVLCTHWSEPLADFLIHVHKGISRVVHHWYHLLFCIGSALRYSDHISHLMFEAGYNTVGTHWCVYGHSTPERYRLVNSTSNQSLPLASNCECQCTSGCCIHLIHNACEIDKLELLASMVLPNTLLCYWILY